MARLQHDMIFINLPVTDLAASKRFYAGLGFAENPVFSDEHTASFEVSDAIVVMLLDTERFNTFTHRPAVEKNGPREVLNCLSVCSTEDADEFMRRAREFGGTITRELAAEGPMYGGAFDDPDGHGWELMYFDPDALADMS
ncbi:lactoylglutathione lyase [Corynebacterium suranareeae]|uniref:Lactoylglutathione lyase n=1 Tax=Corynebacterium suranareeae TaxID=2506452 RepID=A0A160PQN7_9CORY|nr:VOC family protein [Corynebacterium suranareeae]BAU95323.1 lactoylglutathione lyase [Corynebacterium suranareeae]